MRFKITIVLAALLMWIQAIPGAADPDNFRDHLARADSLYEAGEYRSSALSYESAFELKEGTATLHHNAACSWALAGETDRAFQRLDSALALGYRNTKWNLGVDS